MDKKGLGKGLDALIPELGDKEKKDINEVDMDSIRANPNQPRKNITGAQLDELAESIKEHGVIQPLIVRPIGDYYEIIAGERRYKAAKKAGLKKVPVVFRELSDIQVMQVALLENIQREDLNAMDKSFALNKLISEHGMTQEEIAKSLGKSRSAIANILRLIKLEDKVQEMVQRGDLNDGHARVCLGLEGDEQVRVAEKIANEGLSVRNAEEFVKGVKRNQESGNNKYNTGNNTKKNRAKDELNAQYKNLQDKLEKKLGTKVRISKGKKKGKIEIEFINDDDLDTILEEFMGR